MSETKPQTPEAKEAASAPAKADKKAGGPPVVLIAVVAGALAAGAALGALLIAPPVVKLRQTSELASRVAAAEAGPAAKGKKKKGAKGGSGGGHGAEGDKSPLFRLDNVIVNPAGSQGQRFLMCSVAVQLEDESLADALRHREVEVRDLVITTLESHTLAELTRPGARDSLRARLAAVLQPLLGHDGEDETLRVFLPQYVIQ